jgi:alanine racemase
MPSDHGRASEPTGAIEDRLSAAGLPPLPRLAWLEIDLAVLAENARILHALSGPETRLGVVVKADGYGHGILAAAHAALRGGAEFLLVATLDEATLLRRAGIAERIIILFPVPPAAIATARDLDIHIVVADDASVAALAAHLRASSSDAAPLRVHLGIDSGMSRGGIAPDRAVEAARALLDAGLDRLTGTWSHLATPEDPAVVAAQVERFEAALGALRAAGIDPGLRHLDATGGLIGGAGPVYDMVRMGLAFYGVLPPELSPGSAAAGSASALRPALRLCARPVTVTTIEPGTGVGYGGTWVASRPTVVATMPVGYADGWARIYSTGWADVRGATVPIIGRISSDALALDVTDLPGFGTDDEVVLLGEPPAMTAHDLAARRGSIAWEVLDAFAWRLPRVYTDGDRPIGVRYLDGAAGT